MLLHYGQVRKITNWIDKKTINNSILHQVILFLVTPLKNYARLQTC